MAAGSIHNLPEELLLQTLSKVPAKNLAYCRCVCKPWSTLVKDQALVKMHETNPKALLSDDKGENLTFFDSEACDEFKKISLPVEIQDLSQILGGFEYWGSCNCVVCLSGHQRSIFLWNPTTKEYAKLPDGDMGRQDEDDIYKITIGFGYNPHTEVYKIVRIVFFCSEQEPEMKVYTLGTNTWRMIIPREPHKEISVPDIDLFHDGNAVTISAEVFEGGLSICYSNESSNESICLQKNGGILLAANDQKDVLLYDPVNNTLRVINVQ
ncbi:hypothetical protein GIB67_009783, partial [Kingdonia uniflora]